MPVEEQLPSAPIVKTVKEAEHTMTVVQRGDVVVEDTIRCTYKPAKSEALSFSVSGEYVETIFVETGDSVKAGDLIAELDMGDLEEQRLDQQYELDSLELQKAHVEQQQNLAIRRCNLQIQQVQQMLNATASSAEQPPEETSGDESSDSSEEPSGGGESTEPESSDPESSDPEPSESSVPESTEPAPTESDSGDSQPETPKEEPEEPESEGADRQQLDRMLKEYNQNLTSVRNQYQQQLQEIGDAIYIQEKRIKELEQQIASRRIYAGIDGTVTFIRQYERGAVSTENEIVATIADISTSVFLVTGEEAASLKIGDTMYITYKKEEHEAVVADPKVLGLSEGSEDEPVAYLSLVQPDPDLEDGTKGSITVIREAREDVLYVKSSVIKNLNGQNVVYYLDSEGLKSMKNVETGLDNGEYVEILSGLEEGEEIIDE